ncbi:MAG: hypothetical protein U0232_22915 [Thermomicrobiales bacterium]
MTEGHQLLERHIALFNQGVRTGDFGPMLAPFAPDATLTFVGIPVGPFHGKAAIAAAYATHPRRRNHPRHPRRRPHPHRHLRLAPRPHHPRRRMILTTSNGAIASLLVRYGLVGVPTG